MHDQSAHFDFFNQQTLQWMLINIVNNNNTS